MKKVLFPILAVAFVVGFSSCKDCKTCEYTYEIEGLGSQTVEVGELCDDELDAVDGKTVTENIGGIEFSVEYKCE